MTPEPRSSQGRSAYDLLLIGVTLSFALPLLAFAVIGSNMRYSGDDYCYAGLFRQQGLFSTLWNSYAGSSPFHGNRVSLTLVSGLADGVGPVASALLPGLVLLFWAIGLSLLLRNSARALDVRLKPLEPVLASLVLMLGSLLLAPALEQSLYWRSGMLPYFAPVVVWPYIAAIIVIQWSKQNASLVAVAGVFLLALFAAAFSETAAAVQATLLLIALAAVVVAGRPRSTDALKLIGTALAGTAVAIGILAFSPSNESRLAGLDQTNNLLILLRMSANHMYLFTRGLAEREFLPGLMVFTLFFWLGARAAHGGRIGPVRSLRRAVVAVAAISLTMLLVILVCMLPSAYAQSSYPVGRALVIASFAAALAAAGVGAIFGALVAGHWPRYAVGLSAVAAALFGLYSILAAIEILDELPRYQRWSSFWDARHAEIVRKRLAGQGELEVILLDHIIPDVAELQPDPNYWYNNCAEWYYDVQELAANQPGWDD